MKNRKTLIKGLMSAFAMLVLIFDSKTAIASAQEGVGLCLRTIIPSLLPLFVLTGMINSCLLGQSPVCTRPLGRLCKTPKGAESLLILGLLAGYPMGAQLISQAYQNGNLSKDTAKRMLGFCNNAGPAFLFGILTPLFESVKSVWTIWLVLVCAALITGYILPPASTNPAQISSNRNISLPDAVKKSTKALAGICGWVILFRVMIGFCNRWFFWLFSPTTQILLSGLLELSNGCVLLGNIPTEGLRFILAGAMLSFGGLCVGMQTMSVTENLGTGLYFPGKLFQTTLSVLICYFLQPLVFPSFETVKFPTYLTVGLVFLLISLLFLLKRKKVVAFPQKLLYNTSN